MRITCDIPLRGRSRLVQYCNDTTKTERDDDPDPDGVFALPASITVIRGKLQQ